jgi:hypothetical protein
MSSNISTIKAAARTRTEALLALLKLTDGLIEIIKDAGPQGAPAGPMYAALMSGGMTLEQFECIMGVLVSAGRLRKQGHLYFFVK